MRITYPWFLGKRLMRDQVKDISWSKVIRQEDRSVVEVCGWLVRVRRFTARLGVYPGLASHGL